MTCSTCRFWLEQTATTGLCRRNPPVPLLMPAEQGVVLQSCFPSMMHDGWCGEHRPGFSASVIPLNPAPVEAGVN